MPSLQTAFRIVKTGHAHRNKAALHGAHRRDHKARRDVDIHKGLAEVRTGFFEFRDTLKRGISVGNAFVQIILVQIKYLSVQIILSLVIQQQDQVFKQVLCTLVYFVINKIKVS